MTIYCIFALVFFEHLMIQSPEWAERLQTGVKPPKRSCIPHKLSPERAKEGLSPLQGSYNDGVTRVVSGASPPPVF